MASFPSNLSAARTQWGRRSLTEAEFQDIQYLHENDARTYTDDKIVQLLGTGLGKIGRSARLKKAVADLKGRISAQPPTTSSKSRGRAQASKGSTGSSPAIKRTLRNRRQAQRKAAILAARRKIAEREAAKALEGLTPSQREAVAYIRQYDKVMQTTEHIDRLKTYIATGTLEAIARSLDWQGPTASKSKSQTKLLPVSGQPYTSSLEAAGLITLGLDDAKRKKILEMSGHKDLAVAAEKSGKLTAQFNAQRYHNPQVLKSSQVLSRVHKSGLYNFGATCWFNSLVQSMFVGEGPYRDALDMLAEANEGDLPPKKRVFKQRATELSRILSLADETPSVAVNEELYDRLLNFVTGLCQDEGNALQSVRHQEDSQQGFTSLLGYLGLADYGHKREGEGRDTLEMLSETCLEQAGLLFTTHRLGLRDRSTNFKAEPQSHLPLTIPRGVKQGLSVQDLINTSVLQEGHLLGDDQFSFTSSAKDKQDTRTLNYYSLPDGSTPREITFQLKRFEYIRGAGIRKISDPIEMSHEIEVPIHSSDGTRVERILVFELDSVISNSGRTPGSGHYVTTRFDGEAAPIYYNDATAERLSDGSAKRVAADHRSQSYILKYKIKRQNPGTASEAPVCIDDPSEIARRGIPSIGADNSIIRPTPIRDDAEESEAQQPDTTVTPSFTQSSSRGAGEDAPPTSAQPPIAVATSSVSSASVAPSVDPAPSESASVSTPSCWSDQIMRTFTAAAVGLSGYALYYLSQGNTLSSLLYETN